MHNPLSKSTRNILWAASLGVYLALVQFTYFFLLEAFLSSRALPFFLLLFFWLIGFLAGLQIQKRGLFLPLLFLSTAAYYTALFLARHFPFQENILPVLGLLIACSSAFGGYFFPFAQNKFPELKSLLLHENNGFIAGIILSLLWAIHGGKSMLAAAPLAGAILTLTAYWAAGYGGSPNKQSQTE